MIDIKLVLSLTRLSFLFVRFRLYRSIAVSCEAEIIADYDFFSWVRHFLVYFAAEARERSLSRSSKWSIFVLVGKLRAMAQ